MILFKSINALELRIPSLALPAVSSLLQGQKKKKSYAKEGHKQKTGNPDVLVHMSNWLFAL